jgi:hypothetical protein
MPVGEPDSAPVAPSPVTGSQPVRWRTRLLTTNLIVFALLVPVVLSVDQPITASAYACNGGNTKYTYGPHGSEGDLAYAYNGNRYPNCGWINYIATTRNQWSGSVSQIGVYNLRTWVCGTYTNYNYSYWLYNTNWVDVISPDHFYGNCGPP